MQRRAAVAEALRAGACARRQQQADGLCAPRPAGQRREAWGVVRRAVRAGQAEQGPSRAVASMAGAQGTRTPHPPKVAPNPPGGAVQGRLATRAGHVRVCAQGQQVANGVHVPLAGGSQEVAGGAAAHGSGPGRGMFSWRAALLPCASWLRRLAPGWPLARRRRGRALAPAPSLHALPRLVRRHTRLALQPHLPGAGAEASR